MGQPTRDFKKLDHTPGSYKSFHKSGQSSSSSGTHNAVSEPHLAGPSKGTNSSAKVDEKLSSLMKYRKAIGLCFKCGSKWGPQHKCAASG